MKRLNSQQVFPFISSTLSVMLMMQPSSLAQLTPDNTLGAENSKITNLDQLRQRIDGGAIRGNSLFHSFLEFNVAENGSIYFANPAEIQNILSRVTGGNASHILGTLGVLGNANLFLMNPHGIIFGENATLDINGSFYATTSDSIQWGENGFFSAIEPRKSNLLSVNPDTLFFNHAANHQGSIINRGNLAVNLGQNITFLGHSVINTGRLIAPGGTIQLLGDRIGILKGSLIDVSHTNNAGTILIGGEFQGGGNLPTATYSYVGSEAILKANSTLNGDGGKVIVWGDKSTRFYGKIEAKGGLFSGNGGFVEVSGKDFLDFRGIVNTDAPNGEIGTLLLDPTNIEIVDFGSETENLNNVDEFSDPDIGGNGDTKIDVNAINKASSNVILQATNNITFNANIYTQNSIDITAEAGNDILVNNYIQIPNKGDINLIAGNNIDLTAPNAYLWSYGKDILLNAGNNIFISGNAPGGAKIDSRPNFGKSGNITIQSDQNISLTDTSIRTDTFTNQEKAGDISIIAQGNINLNQSVLSSNVQENVQGDVGTITIQGNSINLKNGSQLQAGFFSGGEGKEGFISLQANDTILIDRSVIFANTDPFSVANGSNVEIIGDNLSLINSVIITDSAGIGNAGNVFIEADERVNIVNTNIFSNIGDSRGTEAIGKVGGITIKGQDIYLSDTTQLQAGFFSGAKGEKGFISLEAKDNLLLDNAILFGNAETLSMGDSSDIFLSGNSIHLVNTSLDTRNAGVGNAGQINIQGTDNISFVNSSIFANVGRGGRGNGGNVNINGNNGRVSFNNSDIFTNTSDENSISGDIFINAKALTMTNGSDLGNSGFGGDSSNITLTTDEFITLDNGSSLNGFAGTFATGGDILIDTGKLNILNGSGIFVSTLGQNKAGNININASEAVDIIGSIENQSGQFLESILSMDTISSGDGGDLIINTPKLRVLDGASVSTSSLTSASGNGGTIMINSQFVEVGGVTPDNSTVSNISSNSAGQGNAGNIKINTDYLIVRDGGTVSSASRLGSRGQGGTIEIEANQSVQIIGNNSFGSRFPSSIDTMSSGRGNAGNITVNTPDLVIKDNGVMSAQSLGTGNGGNITLNVPNSVLLDRNSQISVETRNAGDAGKITINSNEINISNASKITASTSGQGNTGVINLQGNNQITLNNNSEISSSVEENARGNSQKITLNTPNLNLNNSQINATTAGLGNAGSIETINNETINLNNSSISTEITSTGQATQPSNIILNTRQLNLNNNSEITASTTGMGNAGNIEVVNGQTINLNQSKITASTSGQGNTGEINLQANNQITLNNNSEISSSVEENARGNAQKIILNTANLNLTNSQINATTAGLGNAGSIETINNQTINLNNSSISTEITSTGQATQPSNIILNTRQLNLNNNSEITASTAGIGDAGNVSISAETINLNNNSSILTIVEQQAIGEGGNINIKTRGNSINLNNRSQISSRSQGLGNAGNIFIDSLGSIGLTDSDISTFSQQSSGGEIRIFGSIMRFRGDSDISTNVNSGMGGGGDIFLNANSIILYDDSDIFAFAQDGQGGNITLNTPVFFGEGYQRIRKRQNTDNLDNNNQVNLDASGAISGSIIAPDLTFIRNSLTELPSHIINTEQLIANTCVFPNPNQTGTFIITGSGGLPERPGHTNRSHYSTGAIQTLPNQDNASPLNSQIIEPQGVFQLPDGRRILSRRCSQ